MGTMLYSHRPYGHAVFPPTLWALCIPTDLMGTLYSHRPYGHDAVFPVTLLGALVFPPTSWALVAGFCTHRLHHGLLTAAGQVGRTVAQIQVRARHDTCTAQYNTKLCSHSRLTSRPDSRQVQVRARHDTCTAQYNTKWCSHSRLTSRPDWYWSEHATTPARHSTTQSCVHSRLTSRPDSRQVQVRARHDTCTAQYLSLIHI